MTELSNLRRQRGYLRTSLTKTQKKIELETDTSILSGLIECMRARYEELTIKDNDILNLLSKDKDVSEIELETEQEDVDRFTTMFYQCRNLVESKIQSSQTVHTPDDQNGSFVSANGSNIAQYQCKLPILKLKEFSGNLKDWLPFWSQFEKIDSDPKLSPSDKLGYLTMCMSAGPAKELVNSYPATAAMYPEVIIALKARYGRPDLLTEFYIRELLKLVIQNAKAKLPVVELYDKLQCHLRNLDTLGVTSENCASILMPLVSSCLPEELLQIWERRSVSSVSAAQPTSKDYLDNLMAFLRSEVEGVQKLELARSGFGLMEPQRTTPAKTMYRRQDRHSESVPTATGLINTSNKSKHSCLFCSSESHKAQDCNKAKSMSLTERQNCVKNNHACFGCLKLGHIVSRCQSKPKCSICKKGHFELLCNNSSAVDSTGHNNCSSLTASVGQCSVLMQTLLVNIVGPQGRTRKARALIDTGSQRSYLLSSTAKEIDYLPVRTETVQHALFGGDISNAVEHKVYKLHLSYNNYRCDFDVLDQEKICSTIPTVPKGPWFTELKKRGIVIEDTGSCHDIEILIGSDVAGRLYTGEMVELESKLVAMKTHLGWTLSGKVPGITKDKQNLAMLVTSLLIKDGNISDLWSLDVLGITDPTERTLKSDIDKATKDHFISTVKVNKEGRFEVRLPFVSNHPPLSENYQSAQKRLQSTIKRLKNDRYLDEYQKVLKGWEKIGIVEEVPTSELENSACYLPHRHVIKLGSTTPVRPVFDASAKEFGKHSLNDCLETGPNLIEKIPTCLARFRERQIGVSSDIAKAFLQISVSQNDRDFLRFLWKDENDQLKIYRHCRVVFGVSPSPFLLESCISLHLESTLELCEEGKLNWPIPVVKQLQSSFYVDNCLVSLDNKEQVEEFIAVASSIMMERQFDLRGWELSGEYSSKPTNVLGLLWHKEEDTLSISNESLLKMDLEKITKKVMLSAAHRIFDPIGIVSGYVLLPKLLLQETWKKGLTWTEEVHEDTRNKFLQWIAEVPLLPQVKIPRWVFGAKTNKDKLTLHVFSDASKLAYAAVVFIRVEHTDKVTVQLLSSKARVTPTTKTKGGMTIPRLELLAASIATRLYKTVVEDFKLSGVETIFWTDATTVLAWIKQNEPWNAFVMNRISEIRMLSEGCEWRHVPGELNPADIPSRGCTLKKLIKLRWWEGPDWLKDAPEYWPQTDLKFDETEINREKRKTIVSSMVASLIDTSTNISSDWYYKKFSQYKKIVRTIAWILRFKNNAQKHKGNLIQGEITSSEYTKAENKVLMLVQKESFCGVTDPKLSSLLPSLDDSGLIRLKTKVSNLKDTRDFCYPIVLPCADHPVVNRIITDEHNSNCHAGTQILMSILRRKYWILGGRKTIRKVLNSCIICKRYTVKPLEAAPIPLPENRVRDAKVFEITGIDLAGPLMIKGDNGSMKKVWVCIFTCAVYRAIQLDVVSSLSTDSFLQAFRRFCSRNGRPNTVYSDNGTNFVGFDSACHKLNWKTITQYSSAKKIHWIFNPPSAPWWGGWWERLIGILKKLLRRVLGRSTVDYEELQTLLCDCQAVINNRPLTYMADSDHELAVITPGMFIHDIEEIGFPEYELIETKDLKRRIKYRNELRKQLRERFKSEYLGQLKFSPKIKKEHNLKIGDVVLLGDDNSKRLNWPVGQVIELIHGKDGCVRVVRVKTTNGMLTRPVQRIYPLETIEPQCQTVNVKPSTSVTVEPDQNELPSVIPSDDGKKSRLTAPVVTAPPVTKNRRGRRIRKPSRYH